MTHTNCGHTYPVCRINRRGKQVRAQLESVKAQLRMAPHRQDLIKKREELEAAWPLNHNYHTPLSGILIFRTPRPLRERKSLLPNSSTSSKDTN